MGISKVYGNLIKLDPNLDIEWCSDDRLKDLNLFIKILERKIKKAPSGEPLFSKIEDLEKIYKNLLNYYNTHDSKYMQELKKELPELSITAINNREQEVRPLIDQLSHIHSKLSKTHKKSIDELKKEVKEIIKNYGKTPFKDIDDPETKWFIKKYQDAKNHGAGFPTSIEIIAFNEDVKDKELILCKKALEKHLIKTFNLNLKVTINKTWRDNFTVPNEKWINGSAVSKLEEVNQNYHLVKDSNNKIPIYIDENNLLIFNDIYEAPIHYLRKNNGLTNDKAYCIIVECDQFSSSKRAGGLALDPCLPFPGGPSAGFVRITNRALYKGRYDDKGNFDPLKGKSERKLFFEEVCVHESMHYICNVLDADIGSDLRKSIHKDKNCLGNSTMKLVKNFYFCDQCIKGMLASLISMEEQGYKCFDVDYGKEVDEIKPDLKAA